MVAIAPSRERREKRSDALTLGGDPRTEIRIARELETLAHALHAVLGDSLAVVLLVGGYARGEGSVVARQTAGSGLAPYNDYDLVAVVRGPFAVARARRELDSFCAEWSARLGVDVDVWPLSTSALARLPRTLFWLDASLGGARVLWGDPAAADHIRKIRPRDVPLDECGRLLANRATGLALTNLEVDPDRDHRRARHAHKAVLACGDVRLLAADRYRARHADRLVELEALAGAPAVDDALVDAYRDAVLFRARPDAWKPPGSTSMSSWYARMRNLIARSHLSYEQWRVGAPDDVASLAAWRGRLFPAPPDVRGELGSAIASLRASLADVAPLLPYLGHPRERLARASIALAYGADSAACRARAARLLGADGDATDDELHTRLVALSHRGG